jgi:hypothetical protein
MVGTAVLVGDLCHSKQTLTDAMWSGWGHSWSRRSAWHRDTDVADSSRARRSHGQNYGYNRLRVPRDSPGPRRLCLPAEQGSSQTLDKYGRALKTHEFGAAYDLMSSSFRAKVSRDDYVRMMRDNPREVDETAERLRGKRGSIEVSAEFEYGLGDQMRSIQEGGALEDRPIRSAYDQSLAGAWWSFIRARSPER